MPTVWRRLLLGVGLRCFFLGVDSRFRGNDGWGARTTCEGSGNAVKVGIGLPAARAV
jgi:hypothetical protein